MECNYCGRRCWRSGRQKNGAQRFYCASCKRYQQRSYQYKACVASTVDRVKVLVRESVGVRGIAGILGIAWQMVLKKIQLTAKTITRPVERLDQASLEVDELWTFVNQKENAYWVAYAIDRRTRLVVDFVVGKRTKATLRQLIDSVLTSKPKVIYTDKLTLYERFLPKQLHRRGSTVINRIERKNLSIRTHLKRLSRRTICFSRSLKMLESCLRIYFWS